MFGYLRRPTVRPTLILICLLALSAAPAARISAQGAERVLRVGQGVYPSTLDPQRTAFLHEIAVAVLHYEGLTRLDADLDTVPGAAESWEFSPDGLALTFHLRAGLTFADGSPLTAEHFRAAVERACDPNTAAVYASILFAIVGCAEFAGSLDAATPVADADAAYEQARAALGVSAPDDRTLEIQLNEPAPYLVTVAATWVFFPIKRELVDAGGEGWWQDPANHAGNGPFTITRIEEEQLISFEANEHYWGGRPQVDRIDYVYIADTAAALEAYRAGDLEIVAVDAGQVPEVREDASLSDQILTYPVAQTTTLSFNLTKPPFDDPKVREAFAYAFDRQTYCDVILNGTCLPTTTWIPEGVPGHVATDAFAFDPAKAREALAASTFGGPDALPDIEFVYTTDNPLEQARAEWVAGQFRDVLGVEITLAPTEFATWAGLIQDPSTFPQITYFGWGQDYPDPQNWLSVFWTCDAAAAGFFGYCNPALDELIRQGDTEIDPERRIGFYEEAGRLLVADAPAIFVYNNAIVALVKPTVSGIVATPADFGWPGQYASLLTVEVVG